MKKILLTFVAIFLFTGLYAQSKSKTTHSKLFLTVASSGNFYWDAVNKTWDPAGNPNVKRVIMVTKTHISFYAHDDAVPFSIASVDKKKDFYTYNCHTPAGKAAAVIIDYRSNKKFTVKLIVGNMMTVYDVLDAQ